MNIPHYPCIVVAGILKLAIMSKKFWSLEKYMVRGSNSIKLLINLINIAYSAMKILPYYDLKFSEFIDDTPQEIRMFITLINL